ncbi:MAG: hypothetical protein VX252_16705 [Myxococcota bacterium]|nr:hypothetical protein [Myxococcota bacterium]
MVRSVPNPYFEVFPVAVRRRTLDRNRLKTQSIRRRPSKVGVRDEARPVEPGSLFSDFVESLPDVLGAADLRAVIDAWAAAWTRDKTVIWGFGAHLIKVGLAPVVVDLMERGAISALMANGAVCVHDLELAMVGKTSEDVGPALETGDFGMARETAEQLNEAVIVGSEQGLGMGEAVGRAILDGRYPHSGRSVLASAVRLGIPVTIHTAIGTDIHHMHPSADGAALGATSYRDFETLAALVSSLQGGVLFNVGSAVILPEVFLKALSIARNLGHRVDRFTTVDLDFVRQYRPRVNVIERPTAGGGRGISLVGHHELMVPLLAAGVIEAHSGKKKGVATRSRRGRSAPKGAKKRSRPAPGRKR